MSSPYAKQIEDWLRWDKSADARATIESLSPEALRQAFDSRIAFGTAGMAMAMAMAMQFDSVCFDLDFVTG
jgi:hypothetical protein